MTKKRRLPKPPPVLDCARVLHYALVDKSVGYVGRTLLFVDGKELGRVPLMAICEDRKVGVLLFHCNRNWKVLGCSGHDSVAAAKRKAECTYPGLSEQLEADTCNEEAGSAISGQTLGQSPLQFLSQATR